LTDCWLQGGHQEDAEEFFGFYLDTLEEELLSILHAISPESRVTGAPVEEQREIIGGSGGPSSHEDGWLEVGRKNRSVMTRTVRPYPFHSRWLHPDPLRADQEHGIADNAHIWRQVPLDVTCAASERLGARGGLARAAARHSAGAGEHHRRRARAPLAPAAGADYDADATGVCGRRDAARADRRAAADLGAAPKAILV
jgi:hypothetical protein